MADHSKWANIKHKKAANDKKRAKVWRKVTREINVVAREGKTSDANVHPRLCLAVNNALNQAGHQSIAAEITIRADLLTAVDVEMAEKRLNLIDNLEDLDDVQDIHFNADIPDKVLEALS